MFDHIEFIVANNCPGIWFHFFNLEGTGGGPNQRDVIQLKKQNKQLSEENNLLKVKIEVLLDMVRILDLVNTF